MKMLYATVASALLLTNANASPRLLGSYEQLLQAVKQGDNVAAIITIDKCAIKTKPGQKAALINNSTLGITTRINFSIFSHYKVLENGQERYAVTSSNAMLVDHRAFGPVFSYGRIRVYDDNTAEIHTAFLDPKTYETKGSIDFTCAINNGTNEAGAIKLYDESA